ncbi:PH domain-containing protein [Jonesia denitrificans]|uniref:PH domain-containing protein n=1 Tax=Jonesia denitrificans TaxID=43674 RepID=UPI0003267874|nr:PH domain-containing protein [Jonesia denitrificans]ASE09733.1 hypothetical protein CEP80_11800 [Jonesia denitrificans]QXB44270.1 PH domain-containing protein [Jonesia denitrificans]
MSSSLSLPQGVTVVRPRWLLAVSLTLAVVITAGLILLVISAPGAPADQGYPLRDVIAWLVLGTIVVGLLLRTARIALIITADGLVIRNYGRTRIVAYPAIVRVTYTTDSDWVAIETNEGHRHTIQALPRSEGRSTLAWYVWLVAVVNDEGRSDR